MANKPSGVASDTAEIAKNCQDLSQCLITELQVIHNSKQLK